MPRVRSAHDPRLTIPRMRHPDDHPAPEGYGAEAVRHMTEPLNFERLAPADGHARHTGPCGDTMEFWIRRDGDRIAAASFQTDGCGATLACGSLLTERARGMTVSSARAIDQAWILAALGGLPEEVRHCALLAATTFALALADAFPQTSPTE